MQLLHVTWQGSGSATPVTEQDRLTGNFLLICPHLGYNGIASLGPVTYRLETTTITARSRWTETL
jgi:hypothetical protein